MPDEVNQPLINTPLDNAELTFNIGNMTRTSTFRTCKILFQLLKLIFLRFWKTCTSACLILLLMYWLYGGVFTLLFLMLALYGIFYFAQDTFLYYPNQPPNSRILVDQPERFHLPNETADIKTRDGVMLNMYLIKHPNSRSHATVLLIHGNAGNIGHRLMIAYYLYNMCHVNVLLLEYRGYGRSTGKPSESGLYIDAETAFQWLLEHKDIDSDTIFVFGSSLGGAVTIKLASDVRYINRIAGVILENTFTSLPDVARNIFKIKALDFLPTCCYKNKYPSEYRIGKVIVPTLFLSGLNDELIPPDMMNTLYKLSGSKQKRLVPFEGGTHNDTCLCAGYYEAFAQFVHEVSANRRPPVDETLITMTINSG